MGRGDARHEHELPPFSHGLNGWFMWYVRRYLRRHFHAVRLLAGDALDDAARWQAADAAVDGSTEPRRFPLRGGGELTVDAHAMRVTGQGG